MKCEECMHFENAYIRATYGAQVFGMRNYGYGVCRKYGRAVFSADEACRRLGGCEGCIRCREIYIETAEHAFIKLPARACMIRQADVSRRKRKCRFYLAEESENGSGRTDRRHPKLRRLIPDRFLLWNRYLRLTRRLRLWLRRAFGL